jgi:urease accessory protein
VLALSSICCSSVALAHPGHDHTLGFGAGFLHPLSGMDHLLAILAVGLWAAQMGGRALWALPAAFVALLLGGAAIAMLNISIAGVEPAIAVSVVVLGMLVATRVRLWTAMSAVLVGVFAFFHGYAHAVEIPAGAGAVSYMSGFAAATAALHAAGILLGLSLGRWMAHGATRWAGAAVAVSGVVLLF